ncbi:MAG: pantoate--beta-alanine ligase [Pseudomonadota bacterium]
MDIAYDLNTLREQVRDWRLAGERIAFVPTMGNLHEGHLSLLLKGLELADRTVVSIFVNPIQFGHGEDYEKYPSTLGGDREKLESVGLDLLFAPNLDELYPQGTDEDTRVTVPNLSDILCGEARPTHFAGVATVVTKLLINVQPDIALFGEKDYQQLLIIKRMVSDLLIPVEVRGMPIVREADGLAMSSRNSYLDAAQRAKAPAIFRTLSIIRDRLENGELGCSEVEAAGRALLKEAALEAEYFVARRTEDLGEPVAEDRQITLLAAVWLGEARLIDNVRVELPS